MNGGPLNRAPTVQTVDTDNHYIKLKKKWINPINSHWEGEGAPGIVKDGQWMADQNF